MLSSNHIFRKNDAERFPAGISMSIHVPEDKSTKKKYFFIKGLIAAALVFGSVFSFISACSGDGFFHFSKTRAFFVCIAGIVWFSFAFSLSEKKPALSTNLACGGIIAVMVYGFINMKRITVGFENAANMFMGALFHKYRSSPVFHITMITDKDGTAVPLDSCSEAAMTVLILLICAVVCRGTVKRPNALLAIGATFPLAELILYFGLVPSYAAFAFLIAGWCGVIAAEINELSRPDGKSAGALFNKNSAQSAAAAAVVMLISFSGAAIYASDYTRTSEADKFRTDFIKYMDTFTWEKFSNDVKDAVIPPSSKSITHDGKLGNVDSVEFTGKRMLEVTLPKDARQLYLKGFTGTDYTGSRWETGPVMPELETKITSPEFFSGRMLKFIPQYADLSAKDVIVRSTGALRSIKYYPSNSAGLLEADNSVRRYGVYFPPVSELRSTVIACAPYIEAADTMESDEKKLRIYANNYCLDVPASFDCAEEFFEGYEGDGIYDELSFIRSRLAQLCEYSLDSGKKPFGSDFANWFITENKKGSCTHFASAAVLLCRSRGIPARYCEGFILKGEDIKTGIVSGENVTVSVPDSRAHAWTEVYIDGFGWLIFDPTPGYGNVMLTYSSDKGDKEKVTEITEVTTEAPVNTESVYTTVTSAVTEIVTTASVTSEKNTEISDTEGSLTTMVPNEDGTDMTTVTSMSAHTSPDGSVFTDKGGEPYQPEITNTGNAATGSEISYSGVGGGESGNDKLISDSKADPAVIKVINTVLLCLLLPAALVAAILARRRLILVIRHRRISSAPSESAVKIWKMTKALASRKGIVIGSPDDNTAAVLSENGFDEEQCRIIVMTVLRARFGGGAARSETAAAAKAYNRIAEQLNAEDNRVMKIIRKFILCSDIYTEDQRSFKSENG